MPTLTPLANALLSAIHDLLTDIEHFESAIDANDDNAFNIVDASIRLNLTATQIESIANEKNRYFCEAQTVFTFSCVLEYFAYEYNHVAVANLLSRLNGRFSLAADFEHEKSRDIGFYIYNNLLPEDLNSNERYFLFPIKLYANNASFTIHALYHGSEVPDDLPILVTSALSQGTFCSQKKGFLDLIGSVFVSEGMQELSRSKFEFLREQMKFTVYVKQSLACQKINIVAYQNLLAQKCAYKNVAELINGFADVVKPEFSHGHHLALYEPVKNEADLVCFIPVPQAAKENNIDDLNIELRVQFFNDEISCLVKYMTPEDSDVGLMLSPGDIELAKNAYHELIKGLSLLAQVDQVVMPNIILNEINQ